MTEDSAVTHFQLNLYNWAKKDSQREVNEEFCFIKKIKGVSSLRALNFLKSFDVEDRKNVAKSLVKGIVGKEILTLAGEELTEIDLDLRKQFNFQCSTNPLTYDLEEEIIQKMIRNKSIFKAHKLKFNKILKIELAPILGEILVNNGDVWSYQKEYDGWIIYTHIDLGGRSQLRYHHTIYNPSGKYTLSPRVINFLSWLGLGVTQWDFLMEEEDLALASRMISELITHFLNAIPDLLP